jgi:hypothetical protein
VRTGDQRNAFVAQLNLARGGRGDLFQLVVDAREIEITRPALRQPETRKEDERHPDDQAEAAILRLGKTLQENFWRKVSAVRDRPSRDGEDRDNGDRPQVRAERALDGGRSSNASGRRTTSQSSQFPLP